MNGVVFQKKKKCVDAITERRLSWDFKSIREKNNFCLRCLRVKSRREHDAEILRGKLLSEQEHETVKA